ncbi:MAG: site-specific integrase, partial [Bacteroidota bacterium]|nr:site-specific integrase [Bacteroidota bacterium]
MKKEKGQLKVKEPIRLRAKKLANGNQSLYLEKYEGYEVIGKDETGKDKIKTKKSYKFLYLYLIPEKTKADKTANEKTWDLAHKIKAQTIVDIQINDSGLAIKKKTKVNLISYVEQIAKKALADTNNKRSEYYTYNSLSYHLKAYKGDSWNINDIDKQYIYGFIEYLKTAKNGNFEGKEEQPTISKNTAHKLFAKFNTALKKAVIDDIITENPMQKVDDKTKPKTAPSKREYLTLDEIKKLIDTDCKRPDIKNAFLFCCLVGVRFQNVKNIKFADIVEEDTGVVLKYKQIKTGTFENLPISDEALKFVPDRTEFKPEDKIFHLPKNETTNDVIREWTAAAGITKDITFHCSRHTAATLNLSLNTPIETVSKLLGHTKIATTQIYAKIMDKN